MKKTIRLTESDLTRIVKRVIKENKKDIDLKRFKQLLNKAKNIAIDELGWTSDAAEEYDVWDLLDEVGGYMDEDDFYELNDLADQLYGGHPDDDDFYPY
jgi:hypothetical protein